MLPTLQAYYVDSKLYVVIFNEGCVYNMEHFSRIKSLREEKGVSRKKCSLDTGISERTIQRYENGYSVGNVEYLRILANYFGVTMEYLINEKKRDND